MPTTAWQQRQDKQCDYSKKDLTQSIHSLIMSMRLTVYSYYYDERVQF